MNGLKILASLKSIRNTRIDTFNNSRENKLAKDALSNYINDIDYVLTHLKKEKTQLLINLLDSPSQLRGYGYVRENNFLEMNEQRNNLKQLIENPEIINATFVEA